MLTQRMGVTSTGATCVGDVNMNQGPTHNSHSREGLGGGGSGGAGLGGLGLGGLGVDGLGG